MFFFYKAVKKIEINFDILTTLSLRAVSKVPSINFEWMFIGFSNEKSKQH